MNEPLIILRLKCLHLRDATTGSNHFAASSYSEFDARAHGRTWERPWV
jgi:hypothetical protein